MNANKSNKPTIKPKNQNRNKKNRRQIIDFIADNEISDSKSISKAIGLKPSRTRDYLKQFVDMAGFCGPTAISKNSQLSHQKTANCHIKNRTTVTSKFVELVDFQKKNCIFAAIK